MEKLCKTQRIPVYPSARGKGNSLAAQGKGKRENRIFPLVENQPFFPIFDQKNRFSTRKPLWKRRAEGRKASPFSKTAPHFPLFWGGERVFQKGSHTFSTAFPNGNQQAERRGSLVRQGEIEFSPVSTGSTSTTAILLYIPSFLFRFAESERAWEGPKSFAAFFQRAENAKAEISRPRGGENALFLMNVLKG